MEACRPLRGSVLRLDQAIVAALSLINDGNVSGIAVLEYEEGMADQLHLEASLFRGHRLQVEVLCTLDLDFILPELILQLLCEGVGEISSLLTIDQLRAVLTDLTFDDG